MNPFIPVLEEAGINRWSHRVLCDCGWSKFFSLPFPCCPSERDLDYLWSPAWVTAVGCMTVLAPEQCTVQEGSIRSPSPCELPLPSMELQGRKARRLECQSHPGVCSWWYKVVNKGYEVWEVVFFCIGCRLLSYPCLPIVSFSLIFLSPFFYPNGFLHWKVGGGFNLGKYVYFFYLPVQIRHIELKNAQNYWKVLNTKDDF